MNTILAIDLDQDNSVFRAFDEPTGEASIRTARRTRLEWPARGNARASGPA